MKQRTLKRTAALTGVGLHSGKAVRVEIHPAATDHGIVFVRTDLSSRPRIPATPASVKDTALATRLGAGEETLCTVEHLLAAFFGLGISNALVSVDGPELPIMDGSAVPFLVVMDEAGVVEQDAPRKIMVVKRAVEVVDPRHPERFVRIEPSREPILSYLIDFGSQNSIGCQQLSIELNGESFCNELSFARTFCLEEQVHAMQSAGLALGGSLENAVVVRPGGAGLLNKNGLRAELEFVRHKMLDLVGDLALLGMPVQGHIIASKAGHDLHTQMASLLAAKDAPVEILGVRERDSDRLGRLLAFPKDLALLDALNPRRLALG